MGEVDGPRKSIIDELFDESAWIHQIWKQITHKLQTSCWPFRWPWESKISAAHLSWQLPLASHPGLTKTLGLLCQSHATQITSKGWLHCQILVQTNKLSSLWQTRRLPQAWAGGFWIHADYLIGVGGDMPNFPIRTVLLETSLLFLLNHFCFFSTDSLIIIPKQNLVICHILYTI